MPLLLEAKALTKHYGVTIPPRFVFALLWDVVPVPRVLFTGIISVLIYIHLGVLVKIVIIVPAAIEGVTNEGVVTPPTIKVVVVVAAVQ